MSKKSLENRVAVVTGGSNGIGRASAIALAEAGAIVFVGDIKPLPENSEQFNKLGITEIQCNVLNNNELHQLITTAFKAENRLDILVNSAGIGMVKQIDAVTEEDWDTCIGINLKAPFFATKYAIEKMKQGGGGAIVNIASNSGLLPRAHDPVYSTSKMALVGMTKSLALCHAPDKIRLNSVCPGPVGDTGMMNEDLDQQPNREAAIRQFIKASPIARACDRMITPQEVAASVLYLVSDASLMVTGTAIAIDGGKSIGVPPVV